MIDVFQYLKYTGQTFPSLFLKVMTNKTPSLLISSCLISSVKHVLASGYVFLKRAKLKCVIRWMASIAMCEGEPFCAFVNITTGFISVCYKSCQAGPQAQIKFLISDLK